MKGGMLMEYAVQTRDYNHDYRWSWEESGSDSLRAKVSLELQNLIEDGKPGVAVIFREGSYHVIITAIYKLGDKPIGTDFSSANIRLNLVFSQITLKKAKGIVRYYLENQSNPGAAFSNIVTWSNTRDKWTINEERIIDAFNSIQEGSESGMVLNCEKGSELQSLLDFDWGQTEGAKYVYQPKSSNPVRIAVDPIPEKPLPPPEPPKISYWKRSLLLFLLLLAALAGLAYQSVNLYQTKKKVDELRARQTNEKPDGTSNYDALQAQYNEQLAKERKKVDDRDKTIDELKSDNRKYDSKLLDVTKTLTAVTGERDLDKAIERLSTVTTLLTSDTDKSNLIDSISVLQNQLSTAKAQITTAKNNYTNLKGNYDSLKGDYDKLIDTIDIEGPFEQSKDNLLYKYYYVKDPALLKKLKDNRLKEISQKENVNH